MSNPYSDLPSAKTMKHLCQSSEDHWLSLQASAALFATATSCLLIVFMVPMVLAMPVGLVCGKSFWSGDLVAVHAWIQSAVLCAVLAAAVIVLMAGCIRVYMRSQFGAPAYDGELQIDLSYEEARKLAHAYLRANCVDERITVTSSGRRQVALMSEGRFCNTYLEASTTQLEDDRTWIVFRGVSKLNSKAILLSSFFNDFGTSRDGVIKMMRIFKPYASSRAIPASAAVASKRAISAFRIVDHAPPPTLSQKQRLQHECGESDRRHLKACS
jgi:hypothetical protein